MMLNTNLKHVESREEIEELLKDNANVMICCGRMGSMCVPVYAIMEKIGPKYPHVEMRDVDFDISVASFIKNLPECSLFRGLPFTIYFKNSKVVKATTSIQNEEQIVSILNDIFVD
ncbi:MAG: thioredoxin [Candidatus Omnitrophica bacterium]|nr:thioredoxin [Candidatus Omnitrophota bacterium]